MTFHKDVLKIDPAVVTEELVANLRRDVRQALRRSGAVVGISGGVDSSVVLALCVRAFGPKRVTGIMMPEADSSRDSIVLSRKLADKFGIETVVEDMTGALVGFGCYSRRDEAMKTEWAFWGDNADLALVRDFASAIDEGREPAATGFDGLKAVEVTAAAYRSAKLGRPVRI